ncbi:MAG: hypothetical protein ABH842_04370 [Candidatus Micrarchaeota archaeon]
MSKIKHESREEKFKRHSEGEHLEIGGFRFTESSTQVPEGSVLIRHEVHGWPIYQRGTLIRLNGEIWTMANEGHQNESGQWTKIRKINKTQLDKIKETIKNSGFFELPTRISENFRDGSAEVWFVNLDGEESKVLLRISKEERKPDALKKLEEVLQKF